MSRAKWPLVSPYGITLTEDREVSLFPAADISFLTPLKELLTLVLVIDSGASISALPKSDAEFLGISVETGKPIHVGGIGGEIIKGWQHLVPIRFNGADFVLPVVFLENESAPRVLGRKSFFDKFLLCFDESKRSTYFVESNSKEAQAIRKKVG